MQSIIVHLLTLVYPALATTERGAFQHVEKTAATTETKRARLPASRPEQTSPSHDHETMVCTIQNQREVLDCANQYAIIGLYNPKN